MVPGRPMLSSDRFVIKRDGRKVPFDQTRIRDALTKAIIAVEAGSIMDPSDRSKVMLKADAKADRFTKDVLCEIGRRCNGSPAIHIEAIQDIIADVIHRDMGRGERSISNEPENLWMSFMLYRQGRAFVREGLLSEDDFREKTIPYSRAAEAQRWNQCNGCSSVKGLNEWFSGKLPLQELILAAERRSDGQLCEAAEVFRQAILEGRLRAIVITGPSASGKTTTTRKAVELLKGHCPGVKFKAMELDNYFKGHDKHQKFQYDVDGKTVEDINYELPESYDVQLINDHLAALLRGEAILTPIYDFHNGVRSWAPREMALGQDEILLLDCMHALSPKLTEAIPKENKIKLYIEAMSLVEDDKGRMTPWTDLRLMRRMLRDVRTRGHPIPANLWHWHLIRMGERFLLPYIFTADIVIDGGLPYELPVHNHMLKNHLADASPFSKGIPTSSTHGRG